MSKLEMPAFDPEDAPARIGNGYPAPFDAIARDRVKRRLGDHGGLVNFGVNLVTLPPGQASSQRHWHSMQDEFVFVVSGMLTLVTDAGEQALGPGMCACFPKNRPDGHCLVNKSHQPATYLEVGDRTPGDVSTYSDIDMKAVSTPTGHAFVHKDGTPYES